MYSVIYITIWLISVSIMDIRSRRVPIWMLLLGGGAVLAVLAGQMISGAVKYYEVCTGILPGFILLLIAFATKKAGYGDGIVLLLVGMVSGGGKGLWIFCISLFLISIFSVILLLCHKVRRNSEVPYLPFLTVAWILISGTGVS